MQGLNIIKKIKRLDFIGGLTSYYYGLNDGQLGVKGDQILEPGYIYLHYISTIESSQDFRPNRGLLSRYTNRVINNNYYRTISINGLDS